MRKMIPVQNPDHLILPGSLHGGGLVLAHAESVPKIGTDVFIAPNATVIGRVSLGDSSSIWFGSVIRGDIAEIRIGDYTNIQDLSILHASTGIPCCVGNRVTVGHRVTLHACNVEDDCLIGMGATILDGAVIGRKSVGGAQSLVTQNTVIPPASLAYGSPARVIRDLSDEEIIHYRHYHESYARLSGERTADFDAAGDRL